MKKSKSREIWNFPNRLIILNPPKLTKRFVEYCQLKHFWIYDYKECKCL